MSVLMNSGEYLAIVEQVKREIKTAQYQASVHVNTELILLYHSIGTVINEHKAWGNKFIENLAADIRREFPASKGYSVRNLKYMAKFAQTYPDREFVQQVVAQISSGGQGIRARGAPLVSCHLPEEWLVKIGFDSPDRKRPVSAAGAGGQSVQL